jgi:iron complex outermembrane receptor protein
MRLTVLAAGVVVSLGIVSPPVTAQVADRAADSSIDEVTVTAQKRSESVEKVPISMTVLSGKDLDLSTAEGIADVLNTVPAVSTLSSYQGGGTLVTIRGVSAGEALLNGAGTVGYYLDSVPFGLVKEAVGPDESAYDLQRIEVLRGPQGTLYGATALNGVVRVLTHDADLDKFEFKARTSGSDTETGGGNYRGDAAVNVPIIDNVLAARAVVGYEHEAGWIDTPTGKNVNDATLVNLRLKVNAQITEAFSATLSQWSARDRYGAPSIGQTADFNSSPYPQPVTNYYDASGIKLAYQFRDFALQSSTSYLNYRSNSSLDFTEFEPVSNHLVTNIGSRVVSEEILATSTGQGDWRWSLGDMVRKATEDVVQAIPEFKFGLNYMDESKSNAVYGEVTRLLMDKSLELTLGLRYFHDDISVNDQTGNGTAFIPGQSTAHATTPRAVITWHPDNDWTVYGSYSQGFRSGFPQNASASELPATQPDRLINYELGSKGNILDGLLVIDTAVYYMDWQHVQQSITVTQNGTPFSATVNGKTASGPGVDVAVTTRPMSGLTVNATLSWNGLKIDQTTYSGGLVLIPGGGRLNFSPEWTAGAGADYKFQLPFDGVTADVSASGNYVSQQYNRVLLGGDVLTGIGNPSLIARSNFAVNIKDHWTMSLYGDNLANYRRSPIPGYGNLPEYYGQVRPRTIGLQAECRY